MAKLVWSLLDNRKKPLVRPVGVEPMTLGLEFHTLAG